MPKKKVKGIISKTLSKLTLFIETIIAFFIVFFQTLFMSVPSKEVRYNKKEKTLGNLLKYGKNGKRRPG
jgi:hypothetical protein